MNVEGFEADILAEPESLRRLAARLAGAEPLGLGGVPDCERVLFLGMGSSRYAALLAVARLRAAGIDAHAEHASTAFGQPPDDGTLVVAISAGGRSPETLHAAHRHSGRGRLVAITNDTSSPLAELADLVLELEAGEERGGIACRSYQATVAVLLALVARLTGADPPAAKVERAADVQERLFDRRAEWLPPLADALDGGCGVWVAAPAERFGSALQSALMLREAPRIVAAGCETGDWSHVDVYLTKRSGYRLLLLSGSPYEPELLNWRRERGFTLASVGVPVEGAAASVEHGATGDAETLLVETSVAELLAAELWRRHPV